MSHPKFCISNSFFDRYMCGQCSAFALALHKVYGLRIETIFDPYSETGHFYVLVDDTHVLDCRGLIPKEEVIKDFGSSEAVFTRFESYVEAENEAMGWLASRTAFPEAKLAIEKALQVVQNNLWLYSPKPEITGRDFKALFDISDSGYAHDFSQEEVDSLVQRKYVKYRRSGKLVLQARGKELLQRFKT